ncbi:transcriptional regulator family: Fungal Specific TF [Penicillium bovifimosum]|uniref:Transcriptional activator of proteases prtT n=1 Tax=Penicillium bovifimosum TaxID=126998 RepID=A0A9W9GU64_9EURO|nr:transcriptional regulator family: Fungal Specific TF [Penicillium bovifimosum]KAJ5129309.1 transcriptional regulator family: Fungal Specific TF [Penicillium bovifimosum]
MTRTGPTDNPIWETKGIAPDDGRIDSVACQDARPKGRIRRSMTACNTCRKLKTRCDVDPRGHACRRCLSLRLECELPETTERFQDNASTWSDATAAIPSIEERLVSLERGMGEMIHLMRQMVNRSPSMSCSPTSQPRSNSVDGSGSESMSGSFYPLKPAQLIRDLQAECFGERDHSAEADILGDIVTQGIVDAKLSHKMIELFVEYFGHWVSINHASSIQRSNTLLFNTACLMAARYLPGLPQHTVRDIALHVQHAVAKMLWKPSPMTGDMLQALTLLCLYSTSIHKDGLMDDWLLSGISINHALASFSFLNTRPGDNPNPDEVLAQLRLWNTLCATQLHSALANGRTVNIQPQYLDQCPRILEHAAATAEDGRIVAEIQLYRIALKLQNSQHRLQFAEPEYEEIERWKMEWAHLLTSDSTLDLNLWFCQLLLHRTATRYTPDTDRLLPEICNTSRLIISKFLQTRFSSAPALIDHVYFIVGYAALTLCDYNIPDPLITQVRGFLLHLAPGGDNLPYQIACIVGEVQRRYSESAGSSPVDTKGQGHGFGGRMQIAGIMPPAEVLDSLVEGYECLEQLMPGYAQGFGEGELFSGVVGVTGGAMPVGLVPRALHDW